MAKYLRLVYLLEYSQECLLNQFVGSGVIMKKVLKEGESDSRPTSSNKCLINYTCRLEEADKEDFVEKADNYELALGEGDVSIFISSDNIETINDPHLI